MSFEEWNEQLEDAGNLEEFIPEHGVTLGDFRRRIYEAERSEEKPIEEFFDWIKNRRHETKTWLFHPINNWVVGEYKLMVSEKIEDLAGEKLKGCLIKILLQWKKRNVKFQF